MDEEKIRLAIQPWREELEACRAKCRRLEQAGDQLAAWVRDDPDAYYYGGPGMMLVADWDRARLSAKGA